MREEILWALLGTSFPAVMTALGASMVFVWGSSPFLHRLLLGCAGGVMMSASVFSLLNPAMEQAESMGMVPWVPAVIGSSLGVFFLLCMDWLIPKLEKQEKGDNHHKNFLLWLAVMLHNIPEGMAVAVSFAVASSTQDPVLFTSALALSLGVGIQNFPEGAAIALPLYEQGVSRGRAFLMGAMSGMMEPIFGVLTVLMVGSVTALLPWILSFAAGAMLFVVVEELIPEANLNRKYHSGTLGVLGGFLLMMILNTAF